MHVKEYPVEKLSYLRSKVRRLVQHALKQQIPYNLNLKSSSHALFAYHSQLPYWQDDVVFFPWR